MFENGEKILKKVSELINEIASNGGVILNSYTDGTLFYITYEDADRKQHTTFEGFADIISQ